MRKFSDFISKHAKLIMLISLILLVPSLIGYIKTDINYDILSYLPQDLDSTEGQKILDEDYSDASLAIVVVEGMKNKDIIKLKEKINKVDGVIESIGLTDVLDSSIPKEILPESVLDQLYNDDNTMFLVKFEGATASKSTMDAIDDIRSIMDKQCFLSGMSALLRDTKDIADKEAPFYVLVAVIFSLIILLMAMESTAVPFIFLLCIGIGILYNLGTNIFFGEISFITKALAAVLQLGVTMDYSIFLMHRYDEELLKENDKKKAMSSAIQATMLSISGSSLTTVAGFAALCTMDLALGKDIGIVMVKGVVIGVICSITVLPSFILIFDKLIHKFKHRTIIPEFKKISKIITNHPKIFLMIFIVVLIPAYIGQDNTKVYYNIDESLPQDMDSIVALNKMKKEFDMPTTHFILVNDKITSSDMSKICDQIEEIDGVKTVLSYNKFIGPGIPEDFIPSKVLDTFKQGGYNMIMVNSKYKSATDEGNNQVNKINKVVKKYDKNAKITGEGALNKDLVEIADRDFKNVSVASIIAIFLIIIVVFKSISIPVLLVAVIEFAIFINMGIPYYTGNVIPFVASIVIGTIQLGATVDYAILMTSRFREELQNGFAKKEAMTIAVQESAKSIMTSGLTFFGATAAVALVSDMELISSLCVLISRGAIISMVVILFILPSFLLIFEGVINKTTIRWKNNKHKNNIDESIEGGI